MQVQSKHQPRYAQTFTARFTALMSAGSKYVLTIMNSQLFRILENDFLTNELAALL